MTIIPDSISTNELLRIQVNAEADFVPNEEGLVSTNEPLTDGMQIAIDAWLAAFETELPGPVAAKALALTVLMQLGMWHEAIAQKKFFENDSSCLLWAADEKLLHMAWSCLSRVDLDDQQCECDED